MFILNIILVCSVALIAGCYVEKSNNPYSNTELSYYLNSEKYQKSFPDYEIVHLPIPLLLEENFDGNEQTNEIDYKFHTSEGPINLKLKRNNKLLSPNFKSYVKDENNYLELLPPARNDCHYLHKDAFSVAAISICQPKAMRGLIFMDNYTLEIYPLTETLQNDLKIREAYVNNFSSEEKTVPHVIKRASFNSPLLKDEIFPVVENVWSVNDNLQQEAIYDSNLEAASNRPAGAGLILELGLFFDEAGYNLFAPYMNYDNAQMQDMLLAYMNGVQALYHHPSLEVPLELVLVRLDIMKKQPSKMPHYQGERGKLLDSFCAYQKSINPKNDSDPNHWDMALYVSGLDFFAYENGKKNGATMGLATVGGVCLADYACIISELGTTNVFGKPYPSAGFTSVYILAHEIGHNLGMHHDGVTNSCQKEGYIMSPSRGTSGETQWSTCSANVMKKLHSAKCLYDSNLQSDPKLDHGRFMDVPGQRYTAKKQCEILLRDKDAIVAPNQKLSTICYSMQCKTPHRSGYYLAGPALEGTQCGNGMYCYGGKCVQRSLPKPVVVRPGGWSTWKIGVCKSSCIEKSRGSLNKTRICNNPKPINTDKGCEGNSYEISLCDDKKICKKRKRKEVTEFASAKCKEFSKLLPELDPKGAGLQAPHEEARVWMGCSIFCKRADSNSYYTPRVELNDLGVSPYFPDGTWCHNSNGDNYYCQQNHCLPENFHFSKISILQGIGEDIPFSQNAHPYLILPPALKNYLSLANDGKPIQKTLEPGEIVPPEKEEWETKDYIDLPANIKEYYGILDENQLDFLQ